MSFTGKTLHDLIVSERGTASLQFGDLEAPAQEMWNRVAGSVNAQARDDRQRYQHALDTIAHRCGNSGVLLNDPSTVVSMVQRVIADRTNIASQRDDAVAERNQAYVALHAIYQAAFGEPADGGLPPHEVADPVIGQITAFREQEVHRSEADAARAAALVEEARSQLEQVRTNAAAQIAEMRAELAGALPEPDEENPKHVDFAATIAYRVAKRTGKVDPSRWLADEASRLATKRNRRDASIAHCLTMLQKAGIPNPDVVAAALVDSDLVLIEGDGEPPMVGAQL
ncbi:hypothetical protein SEA_MORGANA_73 [Gordonia phage Morgana]|uniref:Helix-turn-helix DNA binding domain protein n=1 Tax=Gordonia phage Morgana TaxID=3137292 RepID=A0AAX4RAQ1_9CAUD